MMVVKAAIYIEKAPERNHHSGYSERTTHHTSECKSGGAVKVSLPDANF